MVHEELKKLYEIDARHSDRPWEFWQYFSELSGEWSDLISAPWWYKMQRYRRNPDAPVWGEPLHDKAVDDMENIAEQFRELAEDARKWRDFQGRIKFASGEISTAEFIDSYLSADKPKKDIIQGYTAEQWQAIIDGKFLCEFSDDGNFPYMEKYFDHLKKVEGESSQFVDRVGVEWHYCRPLRIKGVRQPWFGGECPVPKDSMVLIKLRSGQNHEVNTASNLFWNHIQGASDIVEFIEL